MNEESQEKKQREEQYKALVDFFKEDSQIKNTLMSIAPKASDEYNEDSRMEYLEQLYSELNNIEFKVMGILKNFNMESVLAESYKEYFKKAKENFSELGYGSQHENLSKIYPYSKLLKDISIKDGNISLSVKDDKNINFIANIKGLEFPIQKDDKEWLAIGIIYKTYEEAELECLKKLIEIVKNK